MSTNFWLNNSSKLLCPHLGSLCAWPVISKSFSFLSSRSCQLSKHPNIYRTEMMIRMIGLTSHLKLKRLIESQLSGINMEKKVYINTHTQHTHRIVEKWNEFIQRLAIKNHLCKLYSNINWNWKPICRSIYSLYRRMTLQIELTPWHNWFRCKRWKTHVHTHLLRLWLVILKRVLPIFSVN